MVRFWDGRTFGAPCPQVGKMLKLLGSLRPAEIINALLIKQELDVGSLAAAIDLGAPNASRVLSRMLECRMLEVTRQGKRHVYRLSPSIRVGQTENGIEMTICTDDGGEVPFRQARR